jgi:hypothetical protein
MSHENPDLQFALDQALESEPSAEELSVLCEALAQRLQTLQRLKEAEDDPTARESWDKEIKRVSEQMAALREEQSITQFVEDSVKFIVEQDRLKKEMGF